MFKASKTRKNETTTEEIKSEKAFSIINNADSESWPSEQNDSFECSQKASMCLKELDESTVNLKYKGNKNHRGKGRFSEYPEVLYKNLLRSIRRYLNEKYIPFKSSIQEQTGSRHISKRKIIVQFYTENIK